MWTGMGEGRMGDGKLMPACSAKTPMPDVWGAKLRRFSSACKCWFAATISVLWTRRDFTARGAYARVILLEGEWACLIS